MDLAQLYVQLTEAIVRLLGGSHALAHVNAGIAIYLAVQYLLRTRRASVFAWQAVLAAELMNEGMERIHYGSWRWDDTLGDIFATMFWPTALFLLARHRRRRWEKEARAARALLEQMAPTPQPVPARAYARVR